MNQRSRTALTIFTLLATVACSGVRLTRGAGTTPQGARPTGTGTSGTSNSQADGAQGTGQSGTARSAPLPPPPSSHSAEPSNSFVPPVGSATSSP